MTLHGCSVAITDEFDRSQFDRAGISNAEVDAKARALIGTHLSDQHMSIYQESRTARALWDALAHLYNQKNKTRQLTLRRELMTVKKTQAESLTAYFSRVSMLRDQLLGADLQVNEDEVVSAVLAGLPEPYDVCIAIIQQCDRDLTMSDCFAKLLMVEEKLSKAEPDPVAFSSRTRSSHRGDGSRGVKKCFYCGEVGHIVPNCFMRKADLKKRASTASVSFANAY